jgi:trehalose 6-phosphate phosphatase
MNIFPPLPSLPQLALPAPGRAALLLDLDGTLLDIAPTPDQVVVPPSLFADLAVVRRHVGDALAVVTGRPIAQVDALLPSVPYAVAGEHGGAIRHAPEDAIMRAVLPSAPAEWLYAAEELAQSLPGVLLERKHHGFVLHYRAAPASGDALRRALERLIAPEAERFVLLPALMAWEVRPVGADKGTAVDALMQRAPFAGRTPIFIGDDTTDEDGMRASRAHGGLGLRVQTAFGSAAAVRAWLAAAAAQ